MVEQSGGTVEHCWWNTHSGTSKKAMVEQWNSDGGTVIVEQCGGKVEQCGWNSVVEHCRWNSDGGTLRWNSVRETVWWTSGTVKMEQ